MFVLKFKGLFVVVLLKLDALWFDIFSGSLRGNNGGKIVLVRQLLVSLRDNVAQSRLDHHILLVHHGVEDGVRKETALVRMSI